MFKPRIFPRQACFQDGPLAGCLEGSVCAGLMPGAILFQLIQTAYANSVVYGELLLFLWGGQSFNDQGQPCRRYMSTGLTLSKSPGHSGLSKLPLLKCWQHFIHVVTHLCWVIVSHAHDSTGGGQRDLVPGFPRTRLVCLC